jgi:DHA1 family multidrug resistance protein-like MFS transporter
MNRKRITSYFAASMLYWAAQYIYVPTLPAYVKAAVASLTAVGVVLSMYGLWSAILRIPTGIIVDTTGRTKAFLVGGFLLAAVGALIMGRGGSVGALTFGRALTGASTATWVPVMVVFAGFFPPEKTVFATSLLAISTSLGQVIATGSTGFLNQLGGYPLAFFVGAGLAVAATVLIASVRIPRTDSSLPRTVSARSIMKIFARPDVLLPSFASAVCQFGVWAVVFAFLPLLARELGAGAILVSLMMTTNLVANTAANLFSTLGVKKTNQRPILFGSFAVFAAGAILAAAARSVPLLFAATSLMGIANGVFYPVLLGLSIEQVDSPHRTTAMGIHQAVYALGMFAGPWIGGMLADALGIRAMFGVIAGFCVAAASLLVVLRPSPVPIR